MKGGASMKGVTRNSVVPFVASSTNQCWLQQGELQRETPRPVTRNSVVPFVASSTNQCWLQQGELQSENNVSINSNYFLCSRCGTDQGLKSYDNSLEGGHIGYSASVCSRCGTNQGLKSSDYSLEGGHIGAHHWNEFEVLANSQGCSKRAIARARHRKNRHTKLSQEYIQEGALDDNGDNQSDDEEHHTLEIINNQTDSDVDLIELEKYSENFDDALLYSTMIQSSQNPSELDNAVEAREKYMCHHCRQRHNHRYIQ